MERRETRQQIPRFRRLRDFDAFELDVTAMDTLKTVVVPTGQQNSGDEWRKPAALSVALPKGGEAQDDQSRGQLHPEANHQSALQANHHGWPYHTTAMHPLKADDQAKPKKKWVSLLLRVGGTLVLFALLFRSFSWSSLWVAMGHVWHGMLLVSLVVGVGGIVLSSYQWRSLLHGERIHYDLADLINLYVVGIAFSHFLPTGMGGDAIKALQVGRESGNSAGSTSAVLLCRITGFFGMLLVALPVLVIWHSRFSGSFLLTFALLSLLVGGMIAGTILSVTLLPKLVAGKWAKSQLARHRFLKRIAFASVTRVGDALVAAGKRPRSMGMALFYGILFWIVAVLNCYAYAVALGIDVPLYFYFVVVPMISLISFLPISINGYGLRESTYVYSFAMVHVHPATALLLALLLDTQALLFGITGGGIYLTLGKKMNEKKQRYAA
jgi:glycosyltransferase 2 family protein